MSMEITRLSSLVEASLKAHKSVPDTDRDAILKEAVVDGIDAGELIAARELLARSTFDEENAQYAADTTADRVKALMTKMTAVGGTVILTSGLCAALNEHAEADEKLKLATQRVSAYTAIERTLATHASWTTRKWANLTHELRVVSDMIHVIKTDPMFR